MTKHIWLLTTLSLCASLVACGSSDDDQATTDAPYTAPAFNAAEHQNGKQITEEQACNRYTQALEKAAQKLGCTMTLPLCPGFIRQPFQTDEEQKNYCAMYDEGVVTGCATFISSLTHCEELASRPCALIYFEGTGTGELTCTSPDAP